MSRYADDDNARTRIAERRAEAIAHLIARYRKVIVPNGWDGEGRITEALYVKRNTPAVMQNLKAGEVRPDGEGRYVLTAYGESLYTE